jgi:hypothetical protein
MEFGYFTLSDYHYENNIRSANEFVANIIDETVYAEEVGLHSTWIGECHFSPLGGLSCPGLVLASVAARTTWLRLASAVTVLPLHHPIRIAEQWATLDLLSGGASIFAACRGYDRREYRLFKVSFEDTPLFPISPCFTRARAPSASCTRADHDKTSVWSWVCVDKASPPHIAHRCHKGLVDLVEARNCARQPALG